MEESYDAMKHYLQSLKESELQGDEYKQFIFGLQNLVLQEELTKKQFHNLIAIYLKQTSNIDIPLFY